MYVNYYQWVPFVLLVEAVMFYLPYSLWNTLSTHSGIDLHSLYESGRSCMTDTVAQRELLLRGMTSQLDRYALDYY